MQPCTRGKEEIIPAAIVDVLLLANEIIPGRIYGAIEESRVLYSLGSVLLVVLGARLENHVGLLVGDPSMPAWPLGTVRKRIWVMLLLRVQGALERVQGRSGEGVA